jgi:hypothetical protein
MQFDKIVKRQYLPYSAILALGSNQKRQEMFGFTNYFLNQRINTNKNFSQKTDSQILRLPIAVINSDK